jgi:WD40 repeat protein
VDEDRSILVGDTEGNIWLASASGQGVAKPIVRDWDSGRMPLKRLIPSPSGRVAALLHTELPKPTPLFAEPKARRAVGRASVWRIGTTGDASAIDLKHKGSVLDIAVSPAKHVDLVLTAGADGQAVLWQIVKKHARRVGVFDHNGKPVAFATFSDSGDQVLTVTDDGVPRLWQVAAAGRPQGS